MRAIYPRLAELLIALTAKPMTMREIDERFGRSRLRDTQAWVLALRRAGLIHIDHWITHADGGSKQGLPVYGADFTRWPDTPRPVPVHKHATRAVVPATV